MKQLFDIPEINRRFEWYSDSCIYEIMTGGYRSQCPVVHKTKKSSGEWIVYLTGKKLAEVASQNEYLTAINNYLNK